MFYLKGKELLAAWSPPYKSPYSKYMKTKTINSVDFVIGRIKPRYSEGEKKSEKELDNLIKFIKDRGPNQFMVILDSGGPHSVAMGAKLARNGFQPVVMLMVFLILRELLVLNKVLLRFFILQKR